MGSAAAAALASVTGAGAASAAEAEQGREAAVAEGRISSKLFVRRSSQLDEFLDQVMSPQPQQAIETTGRVG